MLVTGAAGMIGRRVVPLLISRGHLVLRAQIEGSSSTDAVVGDLLEDAASSECLVAMQEHAVDTVVHLAGMASADAVKDDPLRGFALNVELTARVLDMSAQAGVQRFVFASSSLVYGATSPEPILESQLPAPKSLYAATKLAAEALVQGYAFQAGVSGEVLRFSNVYGPDSPPTTVVGKVIADLRSGRTVEVRTTRPIRDFVYVDDVADAIERFVSSSTLSRFGVTHVSSGTGTSVGQLVAQACRAAGVDSPPIDEPNREDQMVLSCSLAKERVGWSLRTNLFDGLRACLGTCAATEYLA